MSLERHGKEWTKKEDLKLEKMFYNHFSFKQMGDELGRTWFACKCRLIRLGLIEGSCKNPKYGDTPYEPFRVPCPEPKQSFEILIDFYIKKGFMEMPTVEVEIPDEEDTSRTFSDAELNIVTDWLKTRLSRVVCKLADGGDCFVRTAELNAVKELLETEIKVANNMKKMTVEEREKVCKRLC